MIDIEQLIELVKKNEYLYDISHKDYKNPSLKTSTWEMIARQLNVTSDLCRLKWKTVRDSYIKYKRMLKKPDGPKGIDYIWSSNLRFLDNHNVNRRSFHHPICKRKPETENIKSQVRDELAYELSSSPPPLAPLGSLSIAEVTSGSFQSNQDLRINLDDSQTKFKEIDATDLLFLSYSGTFKKFPARQQTLMKLELAKLFANAELQQLDEAEQSRVQAAESLPVIIKTEYTDRAESEMSGGFSDDVTDVNPAKRKRLNSKSQN
ncbi:hypothetical protein PYW07_008479 [Mythimna separata]|uniref:MADF domain-containing protein n=1 Tax=Mythimna separata TaxID=271217 RepID=A0AAD7YDI9_MYTSE|nr:hypothetical protein PYW07_008479 [Mythimna separata]